MIGMMGFYYVLVVPCQLCGHPLRTRSARARPLTLREGDGISPSHICEQIGVDPI